jgi:Fur family ferric uptake transcriptional regulator
MAGRADTDANALLRDKGLRTTRCRRAVLATVAAADEPLTVEQIADALAGEGFDLSTIYRTVETFEQHGMLNRLDLGDGTRRYCGCDGHHHHIRCLKCGRIDKVDLCLVERMQGAIEKTLGYRIVDHSLVFTGVCRRCRRTRPGT